MSAGGDHVRLIAVGNGKSMREVEGFPLRQVRFERRPHLRLARVGEQEFDDRPPLRRLFDGEEGLPGNEAVLDGLLPRGAAFALPHDHPDAVVPEVQGLPRPLHAVAENGHRLPLEDLLGSAQWKFLRGHDLFPDAAKIDLCHVCLLCLLK